MQEDLKRLAEEKREKSEDPNHLERSPFFPSPPLQLDNEVFIVFYRSLSHVHDKIEV